MKKQFIYLLVSLILFGSCTVERRLYRPGLSIQWSGLKRDKVQDPILTNEKKPAINQGIPEERIENDHTLVESNENLSGRDIQIDGSLIDYQEQTSEPSAIFSDNYRDREDTTQVSSEDDDLGAEEDRYNEARSGNKNGWLYILFMIVFYAILGTILYFGALYPLEAGVILLVPLSILFGLEDRAGFLFGNFSGLSYVGLFFLSGSVGFWGIFFLGFLALILSLALATYLDDLWDRGERKDDYPPPPPPQMDPGEDW